MTTDRADSGYPAPIVAYWNNWPAGWADGIDAGLDWGNGKVYLFRDSQYVRYDIATDRVDPGYPQPIAGNWGWNWPASFTSVDAAVKWPNGKIYFFRGSQYLRYDIATNSIDPGYPAPVAGNWPGLFTGGVDYGFMHPNGLAYFFLGTQYQRFNPATNVVDWTLPIVGQWPGVPF
jgi:Hemopexin